MFQAREKIIFKLRGVVPTNWRIHYIYYYICIIIYVTENEKIAHLANAFFRYIIMKTLKKTIINISLFMFFSCFHTYYVSKKCIIIIIYTIIIYNKLYL